MKYVSLFIYTRPEEVKTEQGIEGEKEEGVRRMGRERGREDRGRERKRERVRERQSGE